MAQLVVSAVGAAVGFVIGGPAGAKIGWVAGAMVGGYAFNKTQDQEGPRLADLKITGTDYGDAIPWVQGSPRIAGQIIWASNRKEHKHTERQGGKGGGGASSTSYTYSVDLLIMLTENAFAGVSRVWSSNELVFGNGQTKEGLWREMRVYTGAADQLPDPLYEAAVGVGNAPAYRGRGYVVIEDLDLGGGGNIPNLTFEIGQYATRPEESDFFYADLAQGTTDDFACTSRVAEFGTRPLTPWVLGEQGLSMRLAGWDFGDIPKRGVYYRWSTGLGWLAAGNAISLDLVFSARTPKSSDAAHTSWANIFYLGGEGVVLSGSITFDAGGAVDSVAVNVWGGGVVRKVLQTPTLGALRVTVYMQSDVARVYVNGEYLGSKTIVGYLQAADTLLLGGQVSAGDTLERQYATLVYQQARVLIGEAQEVKPMVRPECGGLFYDGKPHPQPLVKVVDALMLRAGYKAADFDTSALRSLVKPVRALALSQVASTRSALEVLQKSWFFDCSAGDKIIFSPRATTSTVRIPFSDLGLSSQAGGEGEPLALRLGNDLEQPAQLALTYANTQGDYNADTQFSDRLVTGQASTQTLQLPLGMTPAEAKAVVDALLFDTVASMHSTNLSVPMRYAYVQAGDDIEVVGLDGRVLRLHVQQRSDNLVYSVLECTLSDVGALVSAGVTDTGYITVTDPTRVPDTVWEALDIPILRDADDAGGFYLAAAPQSIQHATDEWKGALAVRSWDDLEYASLLTLLDASVLGTCSTVLPAWQGGAVFDEASTLVVTVWGQLASSTRETMLLDESVNAMVVGDEVVRFRHAQLLSADAAANRHTYHLSSFLRGQRGTEWAIGTHVPNERCVLLTGALRRVASQPNEMQQPMQLKVLTTGKLLSSVEPRAFTDTGVALKPFSVAGLRGLVDADGVHLSWQRRTRLAYRYGGLGPVVPLGEATEQYRVRVYSAGNVLLREAVAPGTAYHYTPAMTVEDGALAGDLLRFEVCQLSAVAGAGYPTEIERMAV